MFYNFSFFAKPSMDFIQLWRDDRALSKILYSTIPIPVHDLKIKVTDFEFFCVKSLQCQLLQSLWLIWIVFGMNGYKILKCFRKEKRVSGELPCPATGLIGHTHRLLPYFMCEWAFAGRLCDKYHKLISWLKWFLISPDLILFSFNRDIRELSHTLNYCNRKQTCLSPS